MPRAVAETPQPEAGPHIRLCVGCRKKAPQAELERFVAINGRVTHDPARRLEGRGAWLHPDDECWRLAIERKAFQRALRTRIDSTETSWQRKD